jgi:hypothetical protein
VALAVVKIFCNAMHHVTFKQAHSDKPLSSLSHLLLSNKDSFATPWNMSLYKQTHSATSPSMQYILLKPAFKCATLAVVKWKTTGVTRTKRWFRTFTLHLQRHAACHPTDKLLQIKSYWSPLSSVLHLLLSNERLPVLLGPNGGFGLSPFICNAMQHATLLTNSFRCPLSSTLQCSKRLLVLLELVK